MLQTDLSIRVIVSLVILIGLLYAPTPVLSQQEQNIRDLIVNGSFEDGIQGEYGVGYGWGGFSNGNAVVGWNEDSWDQVVIDGQKAQLIEIRNATEQDRYAGIYQTVRVVPGKQYRLTIRGLIRSTEGSIEDSNYGYRLQYAVDTEGNTDWEAIPASEWTEIPWNEQSLYDPEGGSYRHETFETTVTAESDTLTLFVRGWKKWINNASGIFNLDDISLMGPAPGNFEVPVAQAAIMEEKVHDEIPSDMTPEEEVINTDEIAPQAVEEEANPQAVEEVTSQAVEEETVPQVVEEEAAPQTAEEEVATVEEELTAPQETEIKANNEVNNTDPSELIAEESEMESPVEEESNSPPELSQEIPESSAPSVIEHNSPSQLPVSGQGEDGSIFFMMIAGTAVLLLLFGAALMAILQQRHSVSGE